jgi:hypothetical protein
VQDPSLAARSGQEQARKNRNPSQGPWGGSFLVFPKARINIEKLNLRHGDTALISFGFFLSALTAERESFFHGIERA